MPETSSSSPTHWLGLHGRHIVVTGAASGIGLAIAQALAAAGAKVGLLDRHAAAAEAAAQALRDSGAQAQAVAADISRPAEVAQAAAALRAAFGPVQGLVNNAGMLRAGPLAELPLELWNEVLAVNLTGGLICAREFGRDMLQAGHGALVHIASISGRHPQTGSGAYSASKAGVLLMSQQLAVEWGPRGVRSNALCPGMIRTPLSEAFYQVPGVEPARAAATASRRVGVAADLAGPALFLLSDQSAYVNGSELMVDGGLECMLMDLLPRPGYNQTSGGVQ